MQHQARPRRRRLPTMIDADAAVAPDCRHRRLSAAAASATSAASDSSRCTPPSKHHRRLHPPDRRSLSLSLYSTTKLEMRLTDAYFHHFPAWLLPADSRHLQKRHRRRKRSRPARLRPHDLIASDFPSSSTVPSASSHSSNSSAKPVSASCTPRPVPHHRPKSTSPSHLLSSEQPHAAWSLPRWPRNWMAVCGLRVLVAACFTCFCKPVKLHSRGERPDHRKLRPITR
ncbi:hypothetical protein DFJ73DRAFT_389960 [Zopfochytrium polystomum]|nr:hypothetical protein DFJ73DRAFT_389960 [Zopfochytrium polystomum]